MIRLLPIYLFPEQLVNREEYVLLGPRLAFTFPTSLRRGSGFARSDPSDPGSPRELCENSSDNLIIAELDGGHTPTLLQGASHAGTADEQDEDDEDHWEKGCQLEVDEDKDREANSDSDDVAEGSDKDDVDPKEQLTRAQCYQDILLLSTMQLSVIYKHIFSSRYIRRFLFPALKEQSNSDVRYGFGSGKLPATCEIFPTSGLMALLSLSKRKMNLQLNPQLLVTGS